MRRSTSRTSSRRRLIAVRQLAVLAVVGSLMVAGAPAAHSITDANPCDDSYTPTFTIQGSGLQSPFDGYAVVTKGVVIADYEGSSPAVGGVFIQDSSGFDGDANTSTSDGLFVHRGPDSGVSVGDLIVVSGTVSEVEGQTQVGGTVSVCSTGNPLPPAVPFALPWSSESAPEQYEGMRVTNDTQHLYVTDTSSLQRFGQITVTSDPRLYEPTQVREPGEAASEYLASNNLNRLLLDDGTNAEYTDPIVFGRGGDPLSAANTLRATDSVLGLTGVLSQGGSGAAAAYRVHPDSPPDFLATNPRPEAAPDKAGAFRAASISLGNYFNTFEDCAAGVGGESTACLGASDETERGRQQAKLTAAMVGSQADVLALTELENDGYADGSAIQTLVTALNTATASGTYAFIDPDAARGTNALGVGPRKVGLIYKPAVLTPVGVTEVLSSTGWTAGGDVGVNPSPPVHNMPVLAQTFASATGTFNVVAVHLVDRDGECDAPDANDGQASCNTVRTKAMETLEAWTHNQLGDPDTLVLGNLNAFSMEDPIEAMTKWGYVDLLQGGYLAPAYTYASGGQFGAVDHALASAGMAPQVAMTSAWHINADEPSALDYTTQNKSAGQQASLYAPDEFRSSEHDPILVDFDPAGAVVQFSKATYAASETAPAARITVERTLEYGKTVTVNYAATAGTATAGTDFGAVSGTLTFAPFEGTKTFDVPLHADNTKEGRETVNLALSAPGGGATLGQLQSAKVVIGASDQRPDAKIYDRGEDAYLGNNIYNSTGDGQTSTEPAQRTETETFTTKVFNDGNVTNTFHLHGSAARPDSTVRYFLGSDNVTTEMLADDGLSTRLQSGDFTTITVKIKVLADAEFGSAKPATVRGTWTGDSVRSDVVKAVVNVRR